jgi:hypothetical protein
MSYFRRFATVDQAIREWGATHYWSDETDQLRRRVASSIVEALGTIEKHRIDGYLAGPVVPPFHYSAAREVIDAWLRVNPDPEHGSEPWQVGRELPSIRRLLDAYENPRRYVTEIAPLIDGESYLFPRTPLAVAETLWIYGFAAMFSTQVREAFLSLSPEEQLLALAVAEGRTIYRDGPRPGIGKGKPKKKRVDNLATKAEYFDLANRIEDASGRPTGGGQIALKKLARREGIKPAAIKKRISRATKRKE